VKIQGQKQISMIFDEPLAYKTDNNAIGAANNFIVYVDGVKMSVDSAVLSDPSFTQLGDLDRVVILNVGSEIDDSAIVTVEVVYDDNDDILIVDQSKKNNLLADETYDARWD
jgi:hypothetical protein